MPEGDIHNKAQSIRNVVSKIQKSEHISQRDKDLLVNGTESCVSFHTYMQNQDMSKARIDRYLRTWHRLQEHIKWELEEVDKKKLTQLAGQLNTDEITKMDGEPMSQSTKREHLKSVRKMYTDYVETHSESLDVSNDFEGGDLISFTLTTDTNYTDPDRLPTPDTVKELVENASKVRDKAYIMTLWSTGGRHTEVLNLQWENVDFSKNIGSVKFEDTKTGGDHSVPLAEAMPFMRQHMHDDPKSSDPEAYVFRSSQSDKQLSAGGAAQILNRVREETEIPNRIKTNPHAFRKARTSYWARQEKNETWICKHMNWAPGSGIVQHYCRLAQEDVEEDVAQHLGYEEKSDEVDESTVLTPAHCHECGQVNGFTSDTCRSCGTVLETGNLYREHDIQQTKRQLKDKMIEKQIGLEDEELEEEAERIVSDKLN